MPTPLEPRGTCSLAALEFAWDWAGPALDWQLVVLDEHLESVFSATSRQPRMPVPAALRERLRPGVVHYWFVRAAVEGAELRCSPVLFRPGP